MTKNDNQHEKIIKNQEITKQIQEEYKELLLPTLKEKTKEITDSIVEVLEKRKQNVNSVEIYSIIAKRSLVDIATGCANSYTAQEILIAFNLYVEMISKIQQYINFPPTVESFCVFLGISITSYENWRIDPNRKDAMDFIHSYLLGTLATGGLTGEVKEISAMYQQKVMGKVEKQAPTVVKYEKTTDVDDIQKQIQALKREKVIDGEWEEDD